MSRPTGGADADAAMEAALREAIDAHRLHAERVLDRVSERWDGPAPLPEAMRYAVLGGGKRLRPVMTLAACAAAGGDPDMAEAPAAALELIHAYSLVHDDLPAMDDDQERRGKPTVHVAFGEANAILVGDALLTDAFAVVAEDDRLSADQRVRCVATLAEAAGARGMVGGQVRDMAMGDADETELLAMHAQKTGALFVAACRLGAICAGAGSELIEGLAAYGAAFGEAFQIGDDMVDLLDLDADDEHEASVNLAVLLGPEGAAARVADATRRAEEALAAVPGPSGTLATLTRWADQRAADALARAPK